MERPNGMEWERRSGLDSSSQQPESRPVTVSVVRSPRDLPHDSCAVLVSRFDRSSGRAEAATGVRRRRSTPGPGSCAVLVSCRQALSINCPSAGWAFETIYKTHSWASVSGLVAIFFAK
jgi:hypothetical protein